MSGLALRYDLGDQDPFVGTRMIDLSLRTADGPTTVSELLRSGRGLLLDLGRPGPTTVEGRSTTSGPRSWTRRWARTCRPAGADPPGRLRVLGERRPRRLPEPALRRWFGATAVRHGV
jgi:hypothetical protein